MGNRAVDGVVLVESRTGESHDVVACTSRARNPTSVTRALEPFATACCAAGGQRRALNRKWGEPKVYAAPPLWHRDGPVPAGRQSGRPATDRIARARHRSTSRDRQTQQSYATKKVAASARTRGATRRAARLRPVSSGASLTSSANGADLQVTLPARRTTCGRSPATSGLAGVREPAALRLCAAALHSPRLSLWTDSARARCG